MCDTCFFHCKFRQFLFMFFVWGFFIHDLISFFNESLYYTYCFMTFCYLIPSFNPSTQIFFFDCCNTHH